MSNQLTVEAAKKRGNRERHLSNKYNFAGPGTEFRARMKGSDFYEKLMKDAGRKVVGTKPYDKPFDAIDGCGLIHDRVYAKPDATGAEVQKADRDFQKCVMKAVKEGKAKGVGNKLRAAVSLAGFEGKLAIENVGLVRKGSIADGGDKQSVLGQKLSRAGGLGKKALGGVKKAVKKSIM